MPVCDATRRDARKAGHKDFQGQGKVRRYRWRVETGHDCRSGNTEEVVKDHAEC